MIITQTPLRVSFVGGGTDLEVFYRHEEGGVISSAIDKYVFIIIKGRFDDKIYINYSKKEIVDRPEEIENDIVRECLLLTGLDDGLEITVLADIPSEGSGLGSSGSFTVGLLNACYAWMGEQVGPDRLGSEACHIEIDTLGRPVGKQDQYIAAYGGLRRINFKTDGSVDVHDLGIRNERRRVFGSNLLLFFTGQTRNAEAILTEQKRGIRQNLQILRGIRDQVHHMEENLANDHLDKVGTLLDRGWQLKKQLASSISNSTIEEMYQKALEAGALGGKVAGAGGGGFLLVYVPREKQNSVRQALRDYREFPFILERDGSKVIFNMRRYEWK